MKYLKKSVYSTLLAAMLLSTSSYADCSYELFTISSTKNTRIIDFINQLSDECGFSIIVTDPNAEKFLSSRLNKTNLKNLTIDEVLNIILEENNLTYSLENNLLKISYLTTKVFSIDYILSTRKSSGSTDVTLSSSSSQDQGGISSSDSGSASSSKGPEGSQTGIQITSKDEVEFWKALDSEFQHVLNRPHDSYKAEIPIINRNAGLVTVTATAKQLKRFSSYLKRLQDKVQLQVLIDVKLLTVTMSKGKSTGVDWSQLYALQNVQYGASAIVNKNAATYDAATGQILTDSIGVAGAADGTAKLLSVTTSGQLNQVIKFLKTQGDVHSISNPKVLTLNNQPALITSGTEYFYKLTSTETLAGGTGAGAQSTNENIQSVFSGVLLTITPEISSNKEITLKINPSLSETTTDIAATDNSQRTMPPDLQRRQLSSVVTVKDGNRVILGGLINTKVSNQSNKVPLLGDIPVLGYLFKYEEKTKTVEELVIIIEPHIIDKEVNSVSLSDLGYESIDNTILTSEYSAKKNKKKNKVEPKKTTKTKK